MVAERARRELVRALVRAYSGELGAAWAYVGHRLSLPPGSDREMLWQILKDEVRHRKQLLRMLEALGGRPCPRSERKMTLVGTSIAIFSLRGGWFLPMYGAARLEAGNIQEYEVLARQAWLAGRRDLVDELLHLGEVDWDHEALLRGRARTHPLWRLVPSPRPTGARDAIRARFAAWRVRPGVPRHRYSLLLR